MAKIFVILFFSLIFEAVGVVLLGKGLKEIGQPETLKFGELLRFAGKAATNPSLVAGVFFEAIFFGGLLLMMSQGDISFVWPLTSLGFVLNTIAARYILHEQVSLSRWMGVLLIMLGAGLITWSEKTKEAAAKTSAAASSSPSVTSGH